MEKRLDQLALLYLVGRSRRSGGMLRRVEEDAKLGSERVSRSGTESWFVRSECFSVLSGRHLIVPVQCIKHILGAVPGVSPVLRVPKLTYDMVRRSLGMKGHVAYPEVLRVSRWHIVDPDAHQGSLLGVAV